MTSTINASTTAGIVTTADTSGVLALQTAGTTAVSISASQVVTLANALPVASGGSGVTTSTGSGANVLGTSPSISGAVLTSMASSVITSGTAVASTSGTSVDFTSIPSWVKRLTVLYSGVSTSGTSNFLVQIGAGSVTTSGYVSGGLAAQAGASSAAGVTSTAGFIAVAGINGATQSQTGTVTILNITSNTWIASSVTAESSDGNRMTVAGGILALGGTLDRVRITTVNGTDTFDAGSVNILYE